MSKFYKVSALLVLLLGIVACGNKGPLVPQAPEPPQKNLTP